MARLINPRNILPLLIFFGVLMLGLRIDDARQMIMSGSLHTTKAYAADEKAEAKPGAKAEAKGDAKPAAKGDAKPDDKAAGDKAKADEPPTPSQDASAIDETSPAEMEVLKQLSGRREQLDKRAHSLDTREALIKVSEQRVDQKIKELQSIRLQLQSMVDQISGAQQTQLENLVKIYETMKPKEAARIFETLDMPILLGVIQRMKPKSTAPIMAEMAPEKAKEVTVALTKQDQLPKPKP